MINDSDQLGLELHVHSEDDDMIAHAPRPAPPVLMWTPRAALELATASLSSSLLTACPLLVVVIGDKAAVFWSLLAATNAEWHTEAVATLVTPHVPIIGCAGYSAAAAVPALHAASTITLYRVSPRRGSPAAFLVWNVQQSHSGAPLSTRAEDAAQLAEALVGALPSVPRKTLVLDALAAAHFHRDGNSHGVWRVLESHAAVSSAAAATASTHDGHANAPLPYLSSADMLDSISAAVLATLQLRTAWCRVVVGVDRDADPCEAVIALAASGARLIEPLLTEALCAAAAATAATTAATATTATTAASITVTPATTAAAMAATTAATLVVRSVAPAAVGSHVIVRHWLATRAKRTYPHL